MRTTHTTPTDATTAPTTTTTRVVHERAFTAIVTGPGHLIGGRTQVEQALRGTGELPPWYAEWQDLLPHWHLDSLPLECSWQAM